MKRATLKNGFLPHSIVMESWLKKVTNPKNQRIWDRWDYTEKGPCLKGKACLLMIILEGRTISFRGSSVVFLEKSPIKPQKCGGLSRNFKVATSHRLSLGITRYLTTRSPNSRVHLDEERETRRLKKAKRASTKGESSCVSELSWTMIYVFFNTKYLNSLAK